MDRSYYYDDKSRYSGASKGRAVTKQEKSNTCQERPEEHSFVTPPQQDFNNEEMRGSMQNLLSDNLGEYVVIEFLIGTAMIVRKQGLLHSVGTSVVTLYDDTVNNYIVCDIFSIKFVYFYLPGQRPNRNYNILPNGNGTSSYGR